MTSLTIASYPADAQAVEAVENHHAQMSGELALLAANLVNAAAGGDATSARDRPSTSPSSRWSTSLRRLPRT